MGLGFRAYQHELEVYVKYPLLDLCKEPGTIILVQQVRPLYQRLLLKRSLDRKLRGPKAREATKIQDML